MPRTSSVTPRPTSRAWLFTTVMSIAAAIVIVLIVAAQ